MNEYCPDAWVLLKFSSNSTEPCLKVLGGWYGGYAQGDSWRMCSGVERIELIGDVYHFHNYSGSVYKCHKDTERFTGLTGSIYNGWLEQIKAHPEKNVKIEVLEISEEYKNNAGLT